MMKYVQFAFVLPTPRYRPFASAKKEMVPLSLTCNLRWHHRLVESASFPRVYNVIHPMPAEPPRLDAFAKPADAMAHFMCPESRESVQQ